jgi:exosortase E/protease (VPEID-CTERM system)
MGAALGAWLLGRALQQFWEPLAAATFAMTYYILQPIHPNIQYYPEEGIIGTHNFLVHIAPQCSGYEGTALVITFVTLYIFVFRRNLRFPAVFLLYTIGAAAVYVLNSVRIAALILIGHYSTAEDAARAFHSQAGWTLFTLLSIGLLLVSRAIPAFNRLQGETGTVVTSRSAFALLLPFLVFLGSGLVVWTLSGDGHRAAVGGLIPTLAVLWRYRATYRQMRWSCSWWSVLIGVAVFVVWVVLADGDLKAERYEHIPWLEGAGGLVLVWIFLRVIVSVLIAPVVEELAFRGYLLRKLASADFESVPIGAFTFTSLAASSLLFGFLHQNWIAGTIAGFAYAVAQWQGRSIGSAVVAHGVSNGLIGATVVFGSRWELWP